MLIVISNIFPNGFEVAVNLSAATCVSTFGGRKQIGMNEAVGFGNRVWRLIVYLLFSSAAVVVTLHIQDLVDMPKHKKLRTFRRRLHDSATESLSRVGSSVSEGYRNDVSAPSSSTVGECDYAENTESDWSEEHNSKEELSEHCRRVLWRYGKSR